VGPQRESHYHYLVSVFPLRGLLARVYLLFPPMGSLSIRAGHAPAVETPLSHARVVLFHIGTTTYIKRYSVSVWGPKESFKAFYSRIKRMSGHYFVLSFFWNYHY
jgi:hypothetical protein